MTKIYIGTAGWTIPAFLKDLFPAEGSHLERYAQVFNAVEINSSFYREHRANSYRRWADSVPKDFRFSVKLARAFIHDTRLAETGPALAQSLESISALGQKWGALLIQLPPSLDFRSEPAEKFMAAVRAFTPDHVRLFWEPRHRTWACAPAAQILVRHGIVKVMADPEPCPGPVHADAPVRYDRWHGSPEIYRSPYERDFLARHAERLMTSTTENWCVFDNTTFGYATQNALELRNIITNELHGQGAEALSSTAFSPARSVASAKRRWDAEAESP